MLTQRKENFMKILVCGGRDYNDRTSFYYYMDDIAKLYGRPITIIEGGARGADRMAQEFAKADGYDLETYPADWKKHGKAAGPIRNKQMLDEGKPDLVVAFPGGKGTQNMVEQAKKANIPVESITKPYMAVVEEQAAQLAQRQLNAPTAF